MPSLDQIKTREEFNKVKEQIKSFTNIANTKYQFRKNEHGVVASVKEINEVKRVTKKAIDVYKRAKKEAENVKVYAGGKEQTTVGQEMKQMGKPNVAGVYEPKPFDFNKVRSRRELDAKREGMEKRADPNLVTKRMERGKDDFIQLIERAYNSDADELVDLLRSIPVDDFYEIYLSNIEFRFEYHYPLDPQASEENVERLMSIVERYMNGKINMDMKGF